VYDSLTKLYRTQAEVVINHVNPSVYGVGQEEAIHGRYKRLKHVCGQACDRSAD
jgi:hypothetical protein